MGKIELSPLNTTPVFRKIAMGTWNNGGDPSVYGLLEIDMHESLKYISGLQKKTDVKITPAHLVGKAIAKVLKLRPEINGIIRFNQIYNRENVDIFYQVNVDGNESDKIKGANLSGCVVRNADNLTIIEIAKSIRNQATKARNGNDEHFKNTFQLFNLLPWSLSRIALKIFSFLNYDLNLNFNWAGIPSDPFGSVMITNVGSFGIEVAWAPLVPYSRVPLLLTVGSIKDQARVIDGQICIRPVMKIGVTFDHRFMDGVHAAAMSHYFQKCFQDPKGFLEERDHQNDET